MNKTIANPNKPLLPKHLQRLEARKLLLQARADGAQAQLERDSKYLATQLPSLVKAEMVTQVSNSSPLVGKVLSALAGGSKQHSTPFFHTSKTHKQSHLEEEIAKTPLQKALKGLSSILLPAIYTFGTSKLLSYSLRSSGTLLRNGVKRLLGIRKKKRRK